MFYKQNLIYVFSVFVKYKICFFCGGWVRGVVSHNSHDPLLHLITLYTWYQHCTNVVSLLLGFILQMVFLSFCEGSKSAHGLTLHLHFFHGLTNPEYTKLEHTKSWVYKTLDVKKLNIENLNLQISCVQNHECTNFICTKPQIYKFWYFYFL